MCNFMVLIATALSLLMVAPVSCFASGEGYRIDWYSLNSGGGTVSGGSYKINASIGQSAAGFTNNTSLLHWVGFWSGDVPTPTIAATVNAAKSLSDGTFICVPGKVATTSATDRFNGFLYLEETDRHSGLRVSCPSGPVAGLIEGKVVNVIGTMGTTDSGERQLVAPLVIITSSATPLQPLGMNNRTIGGANFGTPPLGQTGIIGGSGLNNVGLLIKTWGQITYKEPGGAYVLISDGSGQSIRVDTAGLSGIPETGYISVIGISSLYTGQAPLVLPRRNSDVEPR